MTPQDTPWNDTSSVRKPIIPPNNHLALTTSASSSDMATTTTTATIQPLPMASGFAGHPRPTLPPLSRIQLLNFSDRHYPALPSPTSSNAYSGYTTSPPNLVSRNPFQDLTPSAKDHRAFHDLAPTSGDRLPLYAEPLPSPTGYSRPHHSLKRPYDAISSDHERRQYPHPASLTLPCGDGREFIRNQPNLLPTSAPSVRSARSSLSDTSSYVGPGAAHITTTPTISSYARAHSISSTSSNSHRLSLFMRQQPRAARAGPDGKDRRSIDPPPVLQLMMNDFDPDSPSDMAEMKSSFFVVHCRLISAHSPRQDVSTLASVTEDGQKEVQRLLLGTLVSSPLFCEDDPDPENRPPHPVTAGPASGPPSPSLRFLPQSAARPTERAKNKASNKTPGTFFIFADLSIRKAGEYRLCFSLMKLEAPSMIPGHTLPIIHTVTSNVFKVVNAKDFDQVQPSTNLVKGLLYRGAGFPLKLKKGTREGQKRRNAAGSEDEDDEDDED